MNNQIPTIVKEFANEHGFNSVSYAGTIEQTDYYGVGVKDENGNAIPTGLPTFIKLEDGKLELICDTKFELLSRFY